MSYIILRWQKVLKPSEVGCTDLNSSMENKPGLKEEKDILSLNVKTLKSLYLEPLSTEILLLSRQRVPL